MSEDRRRAAEEALFCEAILAKSGTNVVSRTIGATAVETWTHLPEGDVFDPASGAQWHYHCHEPPEPGEHGHFHCFLRPDGRDGPVHHLAALGVDRFGRLRRIFTVNHWVVGDDFADAGRTAALLPGFDVQLATPDYLVNRWLTAIIRLYGEEIAGLVHARDRRLAQHIPRTGGDPREDRALEVTSAMEVDLRRTARELGIAATAAD